VAEVKVCVVGRCQRSSGAELLGGLAQQVLAAVVKAKGHVCLGQARVGTDGALELAHGLVEVPCLLQRFATLEEMAGITTVPVVYHDGKLQ